MTSRHYKTPSQGPAQGSKKNKKFAKVAESELQRLVIGYLEAAGHLVVRVPIGAYPFRKRDGTIGYGKNPLKGFPDLLVWLQQYPGVCVPIELKSDDGRLRPEQKEWLERFERGGVRTIVARSLAEVVAALRSIDLGF